MGKAEILFLENTTKFCSHRIGNLPGNHLNRCRNRVAGAQCASQVDRLHPAIQLTNRCSLAVRFMRKEMYGPLAADKT